MYENHPNRIRVADHLKNPAAALYADNFHFCQTANAETSKYRDCWPNPDTVKELGPGAIVAVMDTEENRIHLCRITSKVGGNRFFADMVGGDREVFFYDKNILAVCR